MRKALVALLFVMASGAFSFAYAAPNYTLTATCDVNSHTMTYTAGGTSGTVSYDAWQGIVGFGILKNGSFTSSNPYDQINTCDNLDDSLSALLHVNSYWFATVYPVADASAFRDYFSGVSGSLPSNNYGISLCTTVGCTTLVSLSIGTSSALGFLDNSSGTSTVAAIGEQCSQAGNFFSYGICVAFSYLFLPDPTILNQWSAIASTTEAKFPFSWVSEVKSSITGLTASSTSNSPTYTINLHDLGLGSTSPIGNILPNLTAFSSTTVLSYIPAPVWNAGQALIAAVLWLALGFDIYMTVRRRHSTV